MRDVRLNIGSGDAEKIAACIATLLISLPYLATISLYSLQALSVISYIGYDFLFL